MSAQPFQTSLLIAALCLAYSAASFGEYNGPGPDAKISDTASASTIDQGPGTFTVQDVRENALTYETTGQQVTVRGHIVKSLGHKRYVLQDSSGTIIMKAAPQAFPDKPVDDKTPVEVIGDMEARDVKVPEIHAGLITIISK